MRKTFLAGVLLAACSVSAAQLVSPQYDSSNYRQAQDYLNGAILLQADGELQEGILAYADKVARGDKVTVAGTWYGIGIYTQLDGQYQLVRELRLAELGLEANNYVSQLKVSANDDWLLLTSNNIIISVPLDAQHQPVLTSVSEIEFGYGNIHLSDNLLAVHNGWNVNTYSITADNGALTLLSTLELPYYPDHIAMSNNTLAVARSSWQENDNNLTIYTFENNQWQNVSSHTMTHESYGYYYTDFVVFSPDGDRIIYGGNNYSYILALDPVSQQLSEISSGENLFGQYFSNIQFISNEKVLVRNNNTLRLYSSNSLQQLASMPFEDIVTGFRDIAVRQQGITLLDDNGLIHLSADTLAITGRLQPGEQDVVLGFDETNELLVLNESYLLKRTNNVLRLYKLNQDGLPQLVQSSTMLELLGNQYYYNNITSRHIGDGLFAIFNGNQYSLLELDSQTDQLQLLSSGVLTDRNDYQLYIDQKNIINIGSDLVVANGDTLNLFKLNENNHFSFADAVVNGASGVSGIAQVQMLMAAGNNIYTVDQQNNIISHFVITNSTLQQKNQYESLSFPPVDSYYLRNNLLTLKSYNFLQIIRIDEDGGLSLQSNQYLPDDYQNWVPVGERFVAVRNWLGLHILAQDSDSGIWQNSLTLSSEQLSQDHQLNNAVLIPLAGNIGLYDSQNRRLLRFSHNSAPYVQYTDRLQLSLHQGKSYLLDLNTVISDEEDTELTFTLQNAENVFSINTENQLTFDGQLNPSDSFEVLAADPMGLISQITFQYVINLAPIVKTTLPMFNTVEAENVQIELAQYFIDPEGQALQFALSSSQNGVSLSANGLLTGKLNTAGTVSISFKVTDSAGAVANHSVQISVAAKPEESSGGSLHWWLLSLLAVTAFCRMSSKPLTN